MSASEFNPSPNQRLVIGGQAYQVRPHPSVPAFAFGQEGRKAFVFQVSGADGGLYALKKFKAAYRVPELVNVCDALARFSQWPGLEVCARQCLVYGRHDDALEEYPDLEYAVLMPWITGSTWYDIVISETPLTRFDALTFANATAQVLSALEESGLAHCDIAAPNVIINGTTGRAHLIDVEDLYAPGFNPPAALPAGTDGYAHRSAADGLWEPAADRFAGAVLLAEMAAWHAPEIRRAADEEHFFGAGEMQVDSSRYQLMRRVLEEMNPDMAALFDQAWFSRTLEDCPRLKVWYEVINEVYHRERLSKVVSDWQPIALPGDLPDTAIAPQPGGTARTPAQPAARQAEQRGQPPVRPVEVPTAPPPVSTTRPISPALVNPASPAAAVPGRPIQPPAVGGPVKEWTPLAIPTPPPSQTGNGSARPIRHAVPPQTDLPHSPPAGGHLEPIATSEEGTALPEAAPSKDHVGPLEDSWEEERAAGLLKPILDLGYVDARNRPLLVWTESPGAAHYLIQEDDNPAFSNPREYKVRSDETRWSPPMLWRRSGKLYYRVRAMAQRASGPWSEVLSLRIGSR